MLGTKVPPRRLSLRLREAGHTTSLGCWGLTASPPLSDTCHLLGQDLSRSRGSASRGTGLALLDAQEAFIIQPPDRASRGTDAPPASSPSSLRPFLLVWAGPLASGGGKHLEGTGILPNSICSYQPRSRSLCDKSPWGESRSQVPEPTFLLLLEKPALEGNPSPALAHLGWSRPRPHGPAGIPGPGPPTTRGGIWPGPHKLARQGCAGAPRLLPAREGQAGLGCPRPQAGEANFL